MTEFFGYYSVALTAIYLASMFLAGQTLANFSVFAIAWQIYTPPREFVPDMLLFVITYSCTYFIYKAIKNEQ